MEDATRENELMRSREQNELQLARLNMVIKATKIGLWDMEVAVDGQGNRTNVFTWSGEFRSMLGFSDETDFPNELSSWSERLHPGDKLRILSAFANHLLDKTANSPFDAEFRLQKKSGEYGYFRASGETIRDADGAAVRVAGSLLDVTETRTLIAEAEKQRAAAESANRAKSAFLSTMSHEIRTPMNAILGITEIQLQGNKIDPELREAFEKIYSSGDLLLGIINDILDHSKIEAGKLELFLDKYDVASLISDTAQLNMMRIGSKQIEFELQVDENVPKSMIGDELRVKQVLNNLLSNAFKYTSSGTVRLSVSTEAGEGDEDDVVLVVTVSDTGQGMTEEQVTKLFDEYEQFNREYNRTKEGTGLGMSITQNLLRLMDGKISVGSSPGKGSVFTVRLPQKIADPTILGPELAESLRNFRTSSRAHMKRVQITREPMPYGKVLIVDDVDTNIYVARGLMVPYELFIDSADSGYAAIEKIKSGNVYDIIFMDHMMPKLDGIETTKILRAMGYDQPIVALTANAVAGQADVFLGNGFDDFISKPIDIRQLNVILNKLIRDKQPPEVIESANRRKAAQERQSPGDSKQQAGMYPRFAEIFAKDARKSLKVLENLIGKGGLDDDELRTYVIHVHGMKGALANVGRLDLTAIALKLEQHAREGNIAFLEAETPAFLSSLRAFIKQIVPDGDAGDGAAQGGSAGDRRYLRDLLKIIKTACEGYDERTADEMLKELRKKTWPHQVKELLDTISEQLLHSDFEEVAAAVGTFIKNEG